MATTEKRSIPSAELSAFCSQVALILSAGLLLYDGMETLAKTTEGTQYGKIYEGIYKDVNETGSLYQALQKAEGFPKYLTEMVGIGEQTGQLERVLNGLADYYGREDRIRSSIIGAVTYPLVLGVMLVLIIVIMIWKVLPVFRRVLSSMGLAMTGAGAAMTNLGSVIGWVVLVLVALAIAAVIAIVILLKTSHREKVMEALNRLFPPLRRVTSRMSSSRVAGVLSMMLSSGFPTGEALRLLPLVLSDSDSEKKVRDMQAAMDRGEAFADAIESTGLFDPLSSRMIRMGVAAGREDQVMAKVASQYEEQVEDGIDRLVAIIEPTLIALLSIVIGAILLSVMLPMAGILSSML